MKTEEIVKRIMKSNEIWYDYNVVAEDSVEINVELGDWKHDHLLIDILMRKNGFNKVDEEITFDDGSDVYSSIHRYKRADNISIVNRQHPRDTDDIIKFDFNNKSFVEIDVRSGDYQYSNGEAALVGRLRFDNKILVGYLGYEPPKEVIEAVRDLGYEIKIK